MKQSKLSDIKWVLKSPKHNGWLYVTPGRYNKGLTHSFVSLTDDNHHAQVFRSKQEAEDAIIRMALLGLGMPWIIESYSDNRVGSSQGAASIFTVTLT